MSARGQPWIFICVYLRLDILFMFLNYFICVYLRLSAAQRILPLILSLGICFSELFLKPLLVRQFQRRFVHRRALLAQRQYLILPVTLRIEPRKTGRERRVAPAGREPS